MYAELNLSFLISYCRDKKRLNYFRTFKKTKNSRDFSLWWEIPIYLAGSVTNSLAACFFLVFGVREINVREVCDYALHGPVGMRATGRPKFISEAESFTPMKREKQLRVSAGIKGFFEVAGSLDLFGAAQRALNILAQLRYENTLENKFSRFTSFTTSASRSIKIKSPSGAPDPTNFRVR